jgi:hypothetical protein
MRRVVRLVLLTWIGLAGLGLEARAQGTVSAPGGVAAGGDIRESTITIGIPPDQVAVITEALKREQKLTDEQRQTIAKLEGNLGVSGGAVAGSEPSAPQSPVNGQVEGGPKVTWQSQPEVCSGKLPSFSAS